MLQLFIRPILPDESPPEQVLRNRHVSVFPASLQIVEEEAFAETSIQSLFFEEGLRHIGYQAFYRMKALRDVFLPSSVEFIEDSAFSCSSLEVIHGVEGSYAHKWSDGHGIPFEMNDYWASSPERVHVFAELLLALLGSFCMPVQYEKKKIKQYLRSFAISMRPQDRAELNPIDYRFP
jgi:hypothetical protein